MKKLAIVAIALAMGVSVAYASSLGLPWYVDNSPAAAGIPPTSGQTSIIFLRSNRTEPMTVTIQYFDQDGNPLGPDAPNNTFTIRPSSSLAFRPVANDPVELGGQESQEANKIPDRPRDVNTKKNGSITFLWIGEDTDLQGQMTAYLQNGSTFAHLMPAGAGGAPTVVK